MMSLPKEYTEVVRDMKQTMRANTLDLDEAEKLLKDQYKILKKINNWDDEKLVLMTAASGTRMRKAPKKKFKGKYSHCGKMGHKGADCWSLDKNKDKCPENWSGKGNNKSKTNKEGGKTSTGSNKKNNFKKTGGNAFKGKCFVCGGLHKSTECPNTSSGDQEHVLMAWDDVLIAQNGEKPSSEMSIREDSSMLENASEYTSITMEESEPQELQVSE
ncbi:hypothetical protein ACA910_020461 [Epithemia clementina (nom. ined.)]